MKTRDANWTPDPGENHELLGRDAEILPPSGCVMEKLFPDKGWTWMNGNPIICNHDAYWYRVTSLAQAGKIQTKEVHLEGGKRYIRRDGKITGYLRSENGMFKDPRFGHCYQPWGRKTYYATWADIVAEYDPIPTLPETKPKVHPMCQAMGRERFLPVTHDDSNSTVSTVPGTLRIESPSSPDGRSYEILLSPSFPGIEAIKEALNRPAEELKKSSACEPKSAQDQPSTQILSYFNVCSKCQVHPVFKSFTRGGVKSDQHWITCPVCGKTTDQHPTEREAFKEWQKKNATKVEKLPQSEKNKEAIDRLIKKIDEIGDFITDNDGFIYYWPKSSGGHLSAWHLRALADELDKRNEPWNKKIEEYFDEMLGDFPPQQNQSPPKNFYQERVIKEKQDLDEKAMRLSIFIGRNPEFKNLKQEEQRRLTEQLKIMWQYSEILGKRIEGFVK